MLKQVFGDRLQGLVLYGSEARGDAVADSDIDLLVLLTDVDARVDRRRCIEALYPLGLTLERPIHAKPVPIDRYQAGATPLYEQARREGIRA